MGEAAPAGPLEAERPGVQKMPETMPGAEECSVFGDEGFAYQLLCPARTRWQHEGT